MPGCEVAESTVRENVRERKRELRLLRQETFVPQSYAWGREGQVDWYEAWAEVGGEPEKLQVFSVVKRHFVCKRLTIGRGDENSNGTPWSAKRTLNSDRLKSRLR